jgi:23S rRNA (guanosine2251-2'-O)-methyltransferase
MNIIYGFHAVNSYLLNKDINLINNFYIVNTRDDIRVKKLIDLCVINNIQYSLKPQKFLDEICQQNHQGVILLLKKSQVNKVNINSLINAKEKSMVIILDGITDPHNLGAILRTAECFAVDAIILPKDNSANVDNEVVAKVSCGAVYNIPIIEVTNLNRTMEELKNINYWIFGTALADNTLSIYDCQYNGKIALVFGNEGKGMRRLVKENCDYLLKIPLLGSTQSLNVSVATGIILSHISYMNNTKK